MLCTCTLISAYSSYLYTHSVNTVEFLTVDETAKEPPQEESGINSPQGLALEATYINQSLSQQMLVVSVHRYHGCMSMNVIIVSSRW